MKNEETGRVRQHENPQTEKDSRDELQAERYSPGQTPWNYQQQRFEFADQAARGKSDLLFRVKKPVQNPSTHPRTMENCSSANSDPRTSGGLISAIYKGESVLCVWSGPFKMS